MTSPEYEDEEERYEKDEYEPEDDYARGGYRDDYKDDYKDSYKDEREDDEYSNYPEDEPKEKPTKKSGDMDVEEFVVCLQICIGDRLQYFGKEHAGSVRAR